MELTHLTKTSLKPVGSIKIPQAFYRRMISGIDKMDTLFGGPVDKTKGLLPGSSFTLTAPGGCGKTTLMLQYAEAMCEQGYACAVVSGEESVHQIAYTAQRLGVKKVMVANINNIDAIAEIMIDFDLIIIDSFQSMKPDAKTVKEKGIRNPKQVEKYCVETLCSAGKKHECAVGFIMHHTKGGVMKGGTIIIHTVDANFCISAPDVDNPTRWVETDGKNRFGPPGKFSAAFEATGYDFSVDAVETADEEKARMNGSSGGSAQKHSKGARRQEELNLLKAVERLTLAEAAKIIGDMQRARFLMSDLHLEGVFKKEGRGASAVFVRQTQSATEATNSGAES